MTFQRILRAGFLLAAAASLFFGNWFLVVFFLIFAFGNSSGKSRLIHEETQDARDWKDGAAGVGMYAYFMDPNKDS